MIKIKQDKKISYPVLFIMERCDCLVRSRLTGLRTFFSEVMLLPKKAPSPSARSRSNAVGVLILFQSK